MSYFVHLEVGKKKKRTQNQKATNDDVLVSILEPRRESGASGQVLQQLPREEQEVEKPAER